MTRCPTTGKISWSAADVRTLVVILALVGLVLLGRADPTLVVGFLIGLVNEKPLGDSEI